MNTAIILGNLGGDPEARFSPSGQKITTFTMASNTRRQGKDETTWYRVVVFGDRLDKLISYLKKGSSVVVCGKLNPPRIYTDREGRPQVQLEIIADSIDFSPFGRGDRPAQEQQQGQGTPYAAQGYSQQQPAYAQQPMTPPEPAYAEPSYAAPQSSFGSQPAYGSGHKPPQEEETIPF